MTVFHFIFGCAMRRHRSVKCQVNPSTLGRLRLGQQLRGFLKIGFSHHTSSVSDVLNFCLKKQTLKQITSPSFWHTLPGPHILISFLLTVVSLFLSPKLTPLMAMCDCFFGSERGRKWHCKISPCASAHLAAVFDL